MNAPIAPASFSTSALPECFSDEEALDEFLSRPQPALVAHIKTVRSPLLVLGAGGKMGPTLAVLAKRAAEVAGHPLRVIAVSRFGDASGRAWLERRGVETLACDLFDRKPVAVLPNAEDIIYLVGLKFGTSQNPSLTWAANTIVPTLVAERFPGSRIVALSTGNVYPLVPVSSGGATEDHPLTPLGEYANAAVARERIFEYHAQRFSTPIVQVRLNYAVELRYGVLRDLAEKVWQGELVDVSNGYFNCIWQGDANDMILRSLPLTRNPPLSLNLTGPGVLSVRETATRLGELMGRAVSFTGTEAGDALLGSATRACKLLGEPPTPLDSILPWTARWVMEGGRSLNRPTHFEVRDGKY